MESLAPALRESVRAVTRALSLGVRGELGPRLEQTLEILSGAIPLTSLAEVYRAVDSTEFNVNHAALVLAQGTRLVTVNMDGLLEAAGTSLGVGADVLHIHGRCDEPRTIVTTIGAYLNGLPEASEEAFRDAVSGRTVLVIGYSARDRDVTTAFRAHPPSSLVWIRHPGTELAYEAQLLIADLRRAKCRVSVVAATAEAYLPRLLSASRRRLLPVPSLTPARSRVWVVPPAYAAALSRVDQQERVLAITFLMHDLGLNREILALLSMHRMRGRAAVVARKQRARALRRLGNPRSAVRLLMRPPLNPLALGDWLANANEVAAVLPSLGHATCARVLDEWLVRRGSRATRRRTRRVGLQARVRRAQRLQNGGRFAAAERDFAIVCDDPNAPALLGLGSLVDAMTWRADLQKNQGNYSGAMSTIDRAVYEWPYASNSQRAYVLAKSSEIRVIAGFDPVSLDAAYSEAVDFATRSSDRKTEFWALAFWAEAVHGRDPGQARRLLARARRNLNVADTLSDLYCRLLSAEFARTEGRRVALDSAVAGIENHPRRNHSSAWYPTYVMGARLIRSEFRAARAKTATSRATEAAELQSLLDAYLRLGMPSAAARAETSLAFVEGRAIPQTRRAEFRRAGWVLEEARARAGDLSDPWHPIL
jgi:hypothetical protein